MKINYLFCLGILFLFLGFTTNKETPLSPKEIFINDLVAKMTLEKTPEAALFSRERIEALAEAIVNGKTPHRVKDAEIVRLFRDLMPHSASQVRLGRTYKAWRRLRAILPKQAIASLHARVRDAEMRSQPHE